MLVVDPGAFSERAALDGADAVLITHEHFDHLDVDALADALAKRPGVHGLRPPGRAAQVDAPARDVVTAVESGDSVHRRRLHGPGVRRAARRDPPGDPAGRRTSAS